MNYIDFHVHAFADKIAQRTIKALSATAQEEPFTNGTLSDTEQHMQAWGIDGYVLLSIATKPSQHFVCNHWAASCKSEHIFPFGSVHPAGEDVFEELERIKALGLYGIKLHPDYQDFFADEERLFPIYRKCGELGLPVLLHAGVDPISPDCVHCTPQAAAKAVEAAPETTFILAHLGGNQLWHQVASVLAGNFGNVYFDTAVLASHMHDDALFFKIMEKHGFDKILFASDCPWDDPKLTVQKIKSFGLTPQQEHAIFAGNAEKLLHLN